MDVADVDCDFLAAAEATAGYREEEGGMWMELEWDCES